jgi:hypothetical protein
MEGDINLMVWGCVGWEGVEVLTEVQGTMDSEQYCDILSGGVVESFEKLEMKEGERIFQQDNDPKHTANRTDKWFKDNKIKVLIWPAQSPDLNPTEHLWINLKNKMKEYPEPPKGVCKGGRSARPKQPITTPSDFPQTLLSQHSHVPQHRAIPYASPYPTNHEKQHIQKRARTCDSHEDCPMAHTNCHWRRTAGNTILRQRNRGKIYYSVRICTLKIYIPFHCRWHLPVDDLC